MRKRIFEIIEAAGENDLASSIYDFFVIFIIVLSLVPLAFKTEYYAFTIIDKCCAVVFIVDYILRWITADYKFKTHSPVSFIKYPFSFMAIIDLLSILPSLTILSSGFKILRIMRMFRALRVLRVFKAVRYSKSFQIQERQKIKADYFACYQPFRPSV